jgi:uncharacterized SAM-binding protein YcdF (DUF218 family)
LKRVLIVVEVLLVALVAASLYLFIFVPSAKPKHADAIVVLSSDRPRYDAGLRLYRQHVAPTLVLSLPAFEGSGGGRCPRFALCFRADPYSTRGEAQAVARLAQKRGWRRIVVVTSRYHLRRARILFRRCTPAELLFVAAPAPTSAYLTSIPLEWGKMAVQLTAQRGCH